MGLVSRVVAPDALMGTARDIALRIAENAPLAVRGQTSRPRRHGYAAPRRDQSGNGSRSGFFVTAAGPHRGSASRFRRSASSQTVGGAKMSSLVTVEQRPGYAVVGLNRPEKKNALNRAARGELLDALTSLRAECRAIVLKGSGDSFCSGVDLKEARADAGAGIAPDPRSDWIDVLIAIREHPAVFIAAVNRLALGGGATLISVCDLAVAAYEAEIGMPEIGFGATSAVLRAGRRRSQLTAKRAAAWLVLTAQRIDGRTAEAWGMVNRSVPLAGLMDEADRLAKAVSAFDAVALSECKRALDAIPASISSLAPVFRSTACPQFPYSVVERGSGRRILAIFGRREKSRPGSIDVAHALPRTASQGRSS